MWQMVVPEVLKVLAESRYRKRVALVTKVRPATNHAARAQVRASGVGVHSVRLGSELKLSLHHSQTFPTMVNRPKPFAEKALAGAVAA